MLSLYTIHMQNGGSLLRPLSPEVKGELKGRGVMNPVHRKGIKYTCMAVSDPVSSPVC